MSKIFLRYGFLFDPAETWDKITTFEGDLAKFFRERDLEAELIKTPDESREDLRLLYITKKPEAAVLDPSQSVNTSKKRLKALSNKRNDRGEFTNGQPKR